MLLDSVVDDSSSKSNYNNDLVSLALTESGIQEGGASHLQDEDVDYAQLADEILGKGPFVYYVINIFTI